MPIKIVTQIDDIGLFAKRDGIFPNSFGDWKSMTGKILAADDTEENLKIISFFLRKAGYEVLEARDGEEALAVARQSQPDLILLDVVMPRLDGYSTCEALKRDERTKNIPFIFLSALEDFREKIRGLEIGGIDYISKSSDRRSCWPGSSFSSKSAVSPWISSRPTEISLKSRNGWTKISRLPRGFNKVSCRKNCPIWEISR